MYEWKTSSVDVPVATTDELEFDMESPVIDGNYIVTHSIWDDVVSVLVENGRVSDISDWM